MNDSMDAYLDYLKARIDKLVGKGKFKEVDFAQAEYNRALDFARRNGQTVRYALGAKEENAR